jgi:hypothetical protein
MSVNRTHQLIKLRSETVENLKRLRLEMGQGSLNSLVMVMIKQMEAYRSRLKNSGWD